MRTINEKIGDLLNELGFERMIPYAEIYHYRGVYCKISYVEGLKAFVIESADNFDDAAKDLFEDSDLYPISLGEDELIKKLRYDLVNFYISE